MTDNIEDYEIDAAFGEDEDGPDEEKSKLLSLDEMDEQKEAEVAEPSDYTQHILLSYLLSAPELWVKCDPIIDAKYFDPQYRPVIANIRKSLKKYGLMPDPDVLHSDTGVLLKIKKDADLPARQEDICDRVEEFCRTTAFQDFLVDSAETIATDSSRGTLAALMKEAARIESMAITRNLGLEVHGDTILTLNKAEQFDNQSTGFKFMDKVFSGGLTRPSFNIVSCASGDGKSIYMQNQLVNYLEMGKNCVFYTLELEEAIVLKRFAAMMTNVDINQVYSHLDIIGHSLHTRGKTDGKLWVKKFPMLGTSMADIAAHYQELTMHEKLDFSCVAIDYIDIMDPNERIDKSNIHIKDKMVAEEMNDWAHKNNVTLWSASQQTKGAQDEKDPRQSGVSGGTPKINTCDNLIIGKRGEDDIEDERWWAHIQKARSSGAIKTKVPLHWDSKTQRMTDGDPDTFEQANPKLFGFKGKSDTKKKGIPDRVKNDPIAKEMGIEAKDTEEQSGSSKNAIAAFARLRTLQHQQQDLIDDETE